MLGNPLEGGAPRRGTEANSRNGYVAALKGKDSGKTENLVKKDAKEVGDKNGFKI